MVGSLNFLVILAAMISSVNGGIGLSGSPAGNKWILFIPERWGFSSLGCGSGGCYLAISLLNCAISSSKAWILFSYSWFVGLRDSWFFCLERHWVPRPWCSSLLLRGGGIVVSLRFFGRVIIGQVILIWISSSGRHDCGIMSSSISNVCYYIGQRGHSAKD